MIEEECKVETVNQKSGMYDRIIKHTGVFGGVQGLITLVTIVRTKIVATLLGTAGFGINDNLNRMLNLVKSSTDLGVPFSAVRTVSSHFEDENDALLRDSISVTRSWALLTAAGGTLLCLLLSPVFSLAAFDGDHGYTLSFILLSPVVAFSTVTGGEMAVLKGVRRLREIAVSQLLSAVLALCISVPVFYLLGLQGIVISLVLVSFSTMVVTCYYSFKAYPYRMMLFSREVLHKGTDMVRLGVYFTVTSFLGAGAFSVISTYLMRNGGAETLGAYSAGYSLMNYLGLFVFSAMEADYFPRLSSVAKKRNSVNVLVNSQMEVAVLLMTPMIVAFLVFLDPIVRILLTEKFRIAVPMAQIAVISLFFKSLTQPMAYISLAKGDSLTFLLQEVLYDVFLVAAIIVCFRLGGLRMLGLAITLAGIFDFIVVRLIVKMRYGFKVTSQTLSMALMFPGIVLLAFVAVAFLDGWLCWTCGLLSLAVSLALSYRELKLHTSFIDSLKEKISKREGK